MKKLLLLIVSSLLLMVYGNRQGIIPDAELYGTFIVVGGFLTTALIMYIIGKLLKIN